MSTDKLCAQPARFFIVNQRMLYFMSLCQFQYTILLSMLHVFLLMGLDEPADSTWFQHAEHHSNNLKYMADGLETFSVVVANTIYTRIFD